jgi:hypothetical protein
MSGNSEGVAAFVSTKQCRHVRCFIILERNSRNPVGLGRNAICRPKVAEYSNLGLRDETPGVALMRANKPG